MPTNNTKRRLALKALGGSALAGSLTDKLPAIWQRPLVHSAALPAHAQASPIQPDGRIRLMVSRGEQRATFTFGYRLRLAGTRDLPIPSRAPDLTPRSIQPAEITHVIFDSSEQRFAQVSDPGLLDTLFPPAYAHDGDPGHTHPPAATTGAPTETAAPSTLTGSLTLTETEALDFSANNRNLTQTGTLSLSFEGRPCEFEVTVELFNNRRAISNIRPGAQSSCGIYTISEAPGVNGFGAITTAAPAATTPRPDPSTDRPVGRADPQTDAPLQFVVVDLLNDRVQENRPEVNWSVYHDAGQATGVGFAMNTTDIAGLMEQSPSLLSKLIPAAHAQMTSPMPVEPDVTLDINNPSGGSVYYMHFEGDTAEGTLPLTINGERFYVPITATRMATAATTTNGAPLDATVTLQLRNDSDAEDSNMNEDLSYGLFAYSGLNQDDGTEIDTSAVDTMAESFRTAQQLSYISFAAAGTIPPVREGDQVRIELVRSGPRDVSFTLDTSDDTDLRDYVHFESPPITDPSATPAVGDLNMVVGLNDPFRISQSDTMGAIFLTLIKDRVPNEGDEDLVLTLAATSGRTRVGDPGQLTLNIIDVTLPPLPTAGESRPHVRWAQADYPVTEPLAATWDGEYMPVTVSVEFTPAPANPTTVYFRVHNGPGIRVIGAIDTGEDGDDYSIPTTVPGELYALESSRTIRVYRDSPSSSIDDGDEFIKLMLVEDPAYTIEPGGDVATITIVDNTAVAATPTPPAPTTDMPPVTAAATTSPPVPAGERWFVWTWSAEDYSVSGEFRTRTASGTIHEEDVFYHVVEVRQGEGEGTRLFTLDLVAESATSGSVTLPDDVTYTINHDFQFVLPETVDPAVMSRFATNREADDSDYPTDFSLNVSDTIMTFGLAHNPAEVASPWELSVNNRVVSSSEDPVITEKTRQ